MDENKVFDEKTVENNVAENSGIDSKAKVIALVLGAGAACYAAGQSVGAKIKKGPIDCIKAKHEARKQKKEAKKLDKLLKKQQKILDEANKIKSSSVAEDPAKAEEGDQQQS